MSSPWKTYCTRAFCTSTLGDSATTLTVSLMSPTAICTLMGAVKSDVSSMFSRFTVLKPCSANVIV